MAIKIGANLSLNSELFDFERQSCKTVAELKALNLTGYPSGYKVYCEETEKWYIYKASNSEDATTGKWREEAIQGAKGDKGDTGAKGDQGEQGPQGEKGDQGPAGADGAKGEKGNQGEKGADGAAAGFGTPTASTTGLAAGAAPTVSVTPSGPNTAKIFAFTFGIPKGDKGDTGAQGPKGDTGAKGETGAAGAAAGFGTPTASATELAEGAEPTVTITPSGTNTAKVFDFVFGIPKGATGAKGPKGDRGEAGAQGPKGDQGKPGTDATVTKAKVLEVLGITGTTNNAANGICVLDASGKVNANNLPSYVDDVIDIKDFVAIAPTSGMTVGDVYYLTGVNKLFTATSATAGTQSDPEKGKIYVRLSDENTYRWSGTTMVEISKSLVIGTTAGTAFDGAKGNEVYTWYTTNKTALEAAGKLKLPTKVAGAASTDLLTATPAADKVTLTLKTKDTATGAAANDTADVPAVSDSAAGVMTPAMFAQLSKLMDKTFPFGVNFSGSPTLVKKGTIATVNTNWSFTNDDVSPVEKQMIKLGSGAAEEVAVGTKTKQFTGIAATTTIVLTITAAGRNYSKSITVTFNNPAYYGAVAASVTSMTETSIKALTEHLNSGKGYTINSINLANQKLCYAYPAAFGALTSIKDANNFDYLASYTRSEVQVNGENYYVYLLTNATTIDGFKQIYA